MKHKLNAVLVHLPGGNRYKVVNRHQTKGSETKGLYLLECIDFWCSEDMGDGIMCWREGQEIWVASYHVDCSMQVYK